MNKYMIADEVDINRIKPEDVLLELAEKMPEGKNSVGFSGMNISKTVMLTQAAAAVRSPIAVAVLIKMMHDKSITKITSLEQLSRFRNCTSSEWKKKTLYVEHPHRNNALIEATLYKDYIIREMVSDIANYISDHLDLSSMVIGLVDTRKANAKVNVSVKKINDKASLECNLDNNYAFTVNDTHAAHPENASYTWIGMFPDVMSAVEHSAGKLEVRKKVSMDLNVNASHNKVAGGIGAKRELEFYILFVKA